VFKSNDRGDTWEVISDDLTAQIDRNTWPVMGKYWSIDAVVKDISTSQYNTLVSLDESPVKPGLIYAGSDDGVIQVTEDDGKTWRKISSFPGVPEYTYVSDIYASRFDENVVYATFDNMKNDDFKPYVLKSSDKGKTWTSIASNLPENGTVHTLEQDFERKELLFAGTEFGIFFSIDEGKNWTQLRSGIPTIAVKDLAIQERENDLVLATFGRGFYVLDNYSPLRELSEELVKKDAHLFEIKDADLFIRTDKIYGQGATYYGAANPEFGATFTFYQKEVPKTQKQIRQKMEKDLFDKSERIPQPTWKELEDESKEIPAYLLVTIKDDEGSIVKTFTKKPGKNITRFNWDLTYHDWSIVKAKKFDPFKKPKSGIYVMPGEYKVEISQVKNNTTTLLAGPTSFKVKALNNATLPADDRKAMVEFQREVTELSKAMNGTMRLLSELKEEVVTMKQTSLSVAGANEEVIPSLNALEKELDEIEFAFKGVEAKASWEEIPPAKMPLIERLNNIIYSHIESSSNITTTSKRDFEILKDQFPSLLDEIKNIATVKIVAIRKQMDQLKAPYTKGRIPIWND